MKYITLLLCVLCFTACNNKTPEVTNNQSITFSKTKYYKYPSDGTETPFKYRLEYNFNNKKPHRWIELDSLHRVTTEYIYQYDEDGNHIGAKYREDAAKAYSIEKVRFLNDSTQITEWVDSLDQVYYTMTDFLNAEGKTYRAEFKGDRVHGYDSTFYTTEGFPNRIFFTNTKGKVYNDRTFRYDSLNANGDWTSRMKIMNDTIRELQVNEVYYDTNFTSADSVFYKGVISSGEWSENVFSFTEDENTMFLTRTTDWDNQFGVLITKKYGLYSNSTLLPKLDSIYNGAISPSGNKIIFCKKQGGDPFIYLTEKVDGSWSDPINLTEQSNIKGGYFYWLNNNELFYYIPEQKGNIVRGKLEQNKLTITDSLTQLNTDLGTEFSPYVDKQMRYIIFSRYVEGDPSQQGFFISYNNVNSNTPQWSTPKKIVALDYGWNAFIINNGSQFLYTDGDNIKSLPLASLQLKYEN